MDSYEVLNASILSMQRTVNAQHNEIIDLKARLAALEHFVERTSPQHQQVRSLRDRTTQKIGIPL